MLNDKNDALEVVNPSKRFSNITDIIESNFFIYDSELNSMYNNVKELYETFKLAKKRFERKDTLQVSKSFVDYKQKLNDCIKYPYVLYDFIYLDTRICVTQYKKKYHVYSTYKPSQKLDVKKSYAEKLYGDFDNLESAKKLFADLVKEYCLNEVLRDLL